MKKTIIHWFLIAVGLLFILIGYCLMTSSDSETTTTDELVVDYTDCTSLDDTVRGKLCPKHLEEKDATNCSVCVTSFTVTKPLIGKVIVYYELTNFDQTSPDYINSRDDNQLKGNWTEVPSENCAPFRYDAASKPILPCGSIANTMFNDDINITRSAKFTRVPIFAYGMLSDSDKIGFQNPETFDSLISFSRPASWTKSLDELDTTHPDNNGLQNERFIAWMRTDWKRKPYGRFSNHGTYKNGLPAGNYSLSVNYKKYNHYKGPRKIIFVATQTTVVPGPFVSGAVLVPIGWLLIIVVGALVYGTRILEALHKKYDDIKASRANGAVANPSQPKPSEPSASRLLTTARATTDANKDSAV
ncbi:cell cycle control protein 50A-like isoform X2 [Epargyreus clarus]